MNSGFNQLSTKVFRLGTDTFSIHVMTKEEYITKEYFEKVRKHDDMSEGASSLDWRRKAIQTEVGFIVTKSGLL